MTENPVLNPDVIDSLRALDPGDDGAFLREIAGLFLEDVPERLAELERSLATGDQPTFTRAAHSIKGSSANIGAVALQVSAEKLESQARLTGLADVAALIANVRAEFFRTRTALEQLTR